MILDAITPKQPRLLVADLDGTLLHDAEVFEDRFITQRSIDTINRAHDAGMQFAIATARPVSTGLQFAEKLPVDAVIYLNGPSSISTRPTPTSTCSPQVPRRPMRTI